MKEKVEEWKSLEIIGYPDYLVNSLGRVKSLKHGKEKLLKLSIRGGYYAVKLCSNGNVKNYRLNRLVAVAFLDNKLFETNLVVNHIDSNPLNNRLDNLELITQRQNSSIEKVFKKNKESIFSENMNVGVSYYKANKTFYLRIQVMKKNSYFGCYKNVKNANIVSNLVYRMINKNYDEIKIKLILNRFRKLYKIN